MNLQENISTQLRRRTHLLDRVIKNLLPNMYPCDYNSSDHFVEGVLDEIRWFLVDVEELQGIERMDIENYILDYKYDELTEYFNERCVVLKNDNLQESIRRILREEYTEKQKKLLTLASQVGFLKTANMVGGVDDLLSILGNDFLNNKNNKIMIIKEVVESTDDEYITLMDMNESPIIVNDEDGEISQIEMLYPNDVAIFHYGGYEYSQDLGETYMDYYTLPKDILDDIFNMVMGYYMENN